MFKLFIEESLTNNMLREFCKTYKLHYSGSKKQLITTITEAYKAKIITEDNINELIVNAAKYGVNRYHFFLSINNIEILTKKNILSGLQNLTNLTNYSDFNYLNNEDTNTGSKKEKDLEYFFDDIELEYCNYNEENYIKFIYTYRYSNQVENEDGAITTTYSKDFYYIEINIKQETVFITTPSQMEYFGRSYATTKVLNTLTDKLATHFEIYFNEIKTQSRQLLHDIFQSITEDAEAPISDLLNNIPEESISNILTIIDNLKIYTKNSTLNLIDERLRDLLQRFIIEENFNIYSTMPEGTSVILKEMRYTDDTEATVKASTSTGLEDDRMEVCDIFFDTRHTIKKSGLVDELLLQWHFKGNDDIVNNNQIQTRLLAGSNYLLIHYQRIQLTQEVVNFVLSHLRNYEKFYY